MTPSTQITYTVIFTFLAVLVFKLLSRKHLLINKKKIETVIKNSKFHKQNIAKL